MPLLIALAWALRQRDCQRAILLADEAEVQDEVRVQMARLLLISGEVNWLFADLDLAETQARLAMASFDRLGNYVGAGDAKWLMASVWLDRGNVNNHGEWLELGSAIALVTGLGSNLASVLKDFLRRISLRSHAVTTRNLTVQVIHMA